MKPAIPVNEDENYFYFEFEYNGIIVHIRKRKSDEELLFNMDDMAKCMGFKDFQNMMEDDECLDLYSQIMKEGIPGVFKLED